jgi:hypothetical protein
MRISPELCVPGRVSPGLGYQTYTDRIGSGNPGCVGTDRRILARLVGFRRVILSSGGWSFRDNPL